MKPSRLDYVLIIIIFGFSINLPVFAKDKSWLSSKQLEFKNNDRALPAIKLEPYSNNNRIQTIEVNHHSIIDLTLIKGLPTVIELPQGEKIQDIAVGGLSDWSQEWEIVKRDSLFFIKPLKNASATSLILSSHLQQYIFDLNPIGNLKKSTTPTQAISRLILQRKPPNPTIDQALQEKQIKQTHLLITQAEAKIKIIEHQLKTAREKMTQEQYKNSNYSLEITQLNEDIQPRQVFDNGRFTYFQFPNQLAIPAIYRKANLSDQETLINYHFEDDFLVAHGTGKSWTLRLGNSVVAVYNEAYEAEGITSVNTDAEFAKRSLK